MNPTVIALRYLLSFACTSVLAQDYPAKPITAIIPFSSGSSQHLAGAMFEQLAGVQMQHVPYRITSQLQSDLVSGWVPVRLTESLPTSLVG